MNTDGVMMKTNEVMSCITSLENSIERYTEALNRVALKAGRLEKSKHLYRSQSSAHDLRDEEQVTVKVRLVFLKIGEIDTLKENYAADIFVYTVWREPSLDGRSTKDVENLDFSKYWNPRLFVDNTLGDPKEELWQSVQFDDSGQASMIEKKRIKGTFLENLELKHFPFDTQDLSITITTERSDTEMELLTDDKKLSSINVQSFIDAQEWDLHTHVETSKKVTTKEYSGSQLKCPALVFTCRAARRPGFFIYNILLIMFFICTLAFVTYSVEKKLTQNRLQLSFTLVLTGVAFKFVVNQSLPKISYLTYLDKYILVSMFILCLVCFWHAIVSVLLKTLGDTETVDKADIFALVVIGLLYIFFHIVFFAHIYLDAGKRRRLMYRKDQEYKVEVKKLTNARANLKNRPSFSQKKKGMRNRGFQNATVV
ncbi:cys-loop ligand-gated ion channel-like isoform X2 [Lineus longissimus]|uniref:cys-loop ligand-gated ion channel-like isoform X2 n=1 Tax=Lineus longissimus TaxID=88925 RepID=UPI00315C5853